MFVITLFILLTVSFMLHMNFAFVYIISRKRKQLKLYIFTAASNVLVSGILIYISLTDPESIRKVNPVFLFWVISGLMLIGSLKIQFSILRKIYQNSQLPENYHLNFFGKKVLHSTVVKPSYLLGFLVTMPILLLVGSYFVARLINLIMFGYL